MSADKDIRGFIGQSCLNAAAGHEVETGILGISDGLGTLISESFFLYDMDRDDALVALQTAFDNAKTIIDKKWNIDSQKAPNQTKH